MKKYLMVAVIYVFCVVGASLEVANAHGSATTAVEVKPEDVEGVKVVWEGDDGEKLTDNYVGSSGNSWKKENSEEGRKELTVRVSCSRVSVEQCRSENTVTILNPDGPQLPTPENVRMYKILLYLYGGWDSVSNATSYLWELTYPSGFKYSSSGFANSWALELSPPEGEYTLRVKARAPGYRDSDWATASFFHGQ